VESVRYLVSDWSFFGGG